MIAGEAAVGAGIGELRDLAVVLRTLLRKIHFGLNDPDYNYVIRSAPEHDRGAEYLHVFRITGTGALLAYAGYAMPMAIWHGMPWSQVPGRVIDGVIYALLTAGTFAWLWPDAPGA